MKIRKTLNLACLLVPVLLMVQPTQGQAQNQEKDFTYAIEINDVLCGYSDIHLAMVEEHGKQYLLLEQEMVLMLSLLGFEVNKQIDSSYRIDPATGRFTYFDLHLQQEDQDLKSKVVIEGDVARCFPLLDDEPKIVALPEGAILPNSVILYHLKTDFIDAGAEQKHYEVLEVNGAVIQQITYSKAGTEELKLAGCTYEAIIIDELNEATRAKTRMWLDCKNGMILKVAFQNGQLAYLADPSVRKKIEVVNYDEGVLTKTNVTITDIRNISYLKVKAVIEPTGHIVTPENLRVPGQRFEGTVEENLIEGVFEIEIERYDGAQAPPFPTKFSGDDSLKKYLDPQELIESDDPVLIAKAREITAGSKDSWEAACRLSQWVGDNITYEIPGGGAARKTYDIRAGECGAHSLLLAAFCRAVGIPARVVWGCIYTPKFEGAFGQHGWNEVYMGAAGWIQVDSTALEVDFVDSGHVRIGDYQQAIGAAVNTKSMEILDHRIRAAENAEQGEPTAEKYAPYVGEYNRPGGGDPIKVAVRDGRLSVEIRSNVAFALNDPDERGKWFCSLTTNLYCTFTRDDEGRVIEMGIHEIVRLRRKSDPQEIGDDVPEDLRPYLGGYYLSALKAEFPVIWDNGKLAFRHPLKQIVVHLSPSEEDGWWLGEFGAYMISFERNEENEVIMMVIDAGNGFRRK